VIPNIIEGSTISAAQRKAWARLIQKIYEVDPLTCPKCQGSIRGAGSLSTYDILSAFARRFTAEVDMPRKRATSAPE